MLYCGRFFFFFLCSWNQNRIKVDIISWAHGGKFLQQHKTCLFRFLLLETHFEHLHLTIFSFTASSSHTDVFSHLCNEMFLVVMCNLCTVCLTGSHSQRQQMRGTLCSLPFWTETSSVAMHSSLPWYSSNFTSCCLYCSQRWNKLCLIYSLMHFQVRTCFVFVCFVFFTFFEKKKKQQQTFTKVFKFQMLMLLQKQLFRHSRMEIWISRIWILMKTLRRTK